MQGQRKELREEEEEVFSGSSGRDSHPCDLGEQVGVSRTSCWNSSVTWFFSEGWNKSELFRGSKAQWEKTRQKWAGPNCPSNLSTSILKNEKNPNIFIHNWVIINEMVSMISLHKAYSIRSHEILNTTIPQASFPCFLLCSHCLETCFWHWAAFLRQGHSGEMPKPEVLGIMDLELQRPNWT